MANSSYVALVTGGNRGIKLEVARPLAAHDCASACPHRKRALRQGDAIVWLATLPAKGLPAGSSPTENRSNGDSSA
jgi:NAD(P)-dependent dehydrogenase (short-subunit alcohol dehydrogenase family)